MDLWRFIVLASWRTLTPKWGLISYDIWLFKLTPAPSIDCERINELRNEGIVEWAKSTNRHQDRKIVPSHPFMYAPFSATNWMPRSKSWHSAQARLVKDKTCRGNSDPRNFPCWRLVTTIGEIHRFITSKLPISPGPSKRMRPSLYGATMRISVGWTLPDAHTM